MYFALLIICFLVWITGIAFVLYKGYTDKLWCAFLIWWWYCLVK
jgi:hypothetical protein